MNNITRICRTPEYNYATHILCIADTLKIQKNSEKTISCPGVKIKDEGYC